MRGYFAAHAPMAPVWFTSTITKEKTEMVPDLARGPGDVKNNTVVIVETPLRREVRWRFAYAAATLVGAAAQVKRQEGRFVVGTQPRLEEDADGLSDACRGWVRSGASAAQVEKIFLPVESSCPTPTD